MAFGNRFGDGGAAIGLAVPRCAIAANVKIAIGKTRRLNPGKDAGDQSPTFGRLCPQGCGCAKQGCLR
jgi:hypothetical protein